MQLQLTYSPVEDRLLLRLDLGERIAALWLTRRAASLLWTVLWERAQHALDGKAGVAARGWLASLRHAQLRETQSIERLPAPLAPSAPPRLVTTLKHGAGANGEHVLCLLDAQGEGETLSLDDAGLHGLIRLVEEAVAVSDWDLALDRPAPVPTVAVSGLWH